MIKIYSPKNLPFILIILLLFAFEACKKDSPKTPAIATPTKLGLYALSDTGLDTVKVNQSLIIDTAVYRELGAVISKIGTQAIPDDIALLVFDTGSGGMVMDANGILPNSMITSSGFNFTTDSTVVNGITITNQTSVIAYGADAATEQKVYGNLAYASVTIGDENGNITIKRLPFFLYYKAVDPNGNVYTTHHDFDVFGVSSEYDLTFANNVNLTSPFSYFDPGNGLTKGFKMAVIGANDYSYDGTYENALTLGLTSTDLSTSSGFTFNTLSFIYGDGYAPIIPGTVTYNGTSFSTLVLFDTGTEPFSYLEDPKFAGSGTVLLPAKSSVALSTTSGFNYSYTTTSIDNLTNVENPGTQYEGVTIMSLDWFLTNEYMIDFTDHRLGIKNN